MPLSPIYASFFLGTSWGWQASYVRTFLKYNPQLFDKVSEIVVFILKMYTKLEFLFSFPNTRLRMVLSSSDRTLVFFMIATSVPIRLLTVQVYVSYISYTLPLAFAVLSRAFFKGLHTLLSCTICVIGYRSTGGRCGSWPLELLGQRSYPRYARNNCGKVAAVCLFLRKRPCLLP
jgi:hypothetical protein